MTNEIGNTLRRKVIRSRRYKPERSSPGDFGIVDTLECGHEVYHKGSQGFAHYRYCSACEDWQTGRTQKLILGNVEEKWDSKTLKPYWIPLGSRNGKGGIRMTTRIAITLTDKTFKELKAYLTAKYGEKRALSLTIEEAVKEFLSRR